MTKSFISSPIPEKPWIEQGCNLVKFAYKIHNSHGFRPFGVSSIHLGPRTDTRGFSPKLSLRHNSTCTFDGLNFSLSMHCCRESHLAIIFSGIYNFIVELYSQCRHDCDVNDYISLSAQLPWLLYRLFWLCMEESPWQDCQPWNFKITPLWFSDVKVSWEGESCCRLGDKTHTAIFNPTESEMSFW